MPRVAVFQALHGQYRVLNPDHKLSKHSIASANASADLNWQGSRSHHYSAPDQNPQQNVSCVCACLKVTLKIPRVLQAISNSAP